MTVYMFTDVSLSPNLKIGSFAYQVTDLGDKKIVGSGLFDYPVEHPSVAEMQCIILAFKNLANQPFANEIKKVVVNVDNLDAIWVFTNKIAKGKIKEENALALSEMEKVTATMPLLEGVTYSHIKAHRITGTMESEIHRWCDIEARKILRSEVKIELGETVEVLEAKSASSLPSSGKSLQNSIHIPIYKKDNDGKFSVIGEDVYEVTYLHGKRLHLRIVVNGYLTHQTINLTNFHRGYKDSILKAIGEYKKADAKMKANNVVKKRIAFEALNCYSKAIQKNVVDYLLPINKEVRRDTLTQYGLIGEIKTKKESWYISLFKKLFK